MKRPNYPFSRVMYIIEAALEYFISIMISGAYLAKIAGEVGLSDSTTGILTSFVSLGCSFQVFAIFLTRKRRVKPFVATFGIINQACFGLVYLIPFFNIPGTAKTVIYMAAILIANALLNVGRAPNTKWFYSYVDDKHRGVFTATNEMVSLLGGTAFSFIIGLVIDKFEAEGNIKGAFLFCRALTDVIYAGSEAQWKSVKVAGDNDLLGFATFSFAG